MTKHGRRPHPNKPDGRTLESEIALMTAKEIGEKYGVSEGTIWRWLREYRSHKTREGSDVPINAEQYDMLINRLWSNEALMHEAASICTYRDGCRPTSYEAASTAAMFIWDAFGDNWDRHSDEEMMAIIDDKLLSYMETYENLPM